MTKEAFEKIKAGLDEAVEYAKMDARTPARDARWHAYLLGFATHAATKSKDSTKVGAVLVGPRNEVRLTAYNGPPRGVADKAERFERPAKYLYAAHGEQNLISFAARTGIQTEGCSIYVTHAPCSSCAKSIIQAGIRAVYFGPGKTSMPQAEFEAADAMFREAGVQVVAIEVHGQESGR